MQSYSIHAKGAWVLLFAAFLLFRPTVNVMAQNKEEY